MFRALFLISIGCVLLSLGMADETISEETRKREQLYLDVYFLKDGVERLQVAAEILKKRSQSQLDMLKTIQLNTLEETPSDGVCDRISGYFNSTFRKYNMFEDRITAKLDEIKEEQTENLDKILVRLNLSKNCNQGSALDIMSKALAEIKDKIDDFEIKLKTFETLEEKLKEQQDKFQALSDAQMKVLQDISEKLTQNQLKFDNFEKQMPNLKEISENVSQMKTPKKAHLPMDIILGLTQNQGKPTAA